MTNPATVEALLDPATVVVVRVQGHLGTSAFGASMYSGQLNNRGLGFTVSCALRALEA